MILSAENLEVSYGRKPVVQDATFTLSPGTVTALIGPNGTGKSSLLKAVAGLIAHSGQVRLKDEPILGPSNALAYMPQETGAASSLTAAEVVLLGRLRSLGLRVPGQLREQAAEMLDRFGLSPLASRTLEALSGGQRQLVFLAQALFRDPAVLLLDEPTAALDLRHQMIVLDAVRDHTRAQGIATVVAVHDLGLAARYADRALCLSGGCLIADGTVGEVLTAERIQTVYGVRAEVLTGQDGIKRITALAPV